MTVTKPINQKISIDMNDWELGDWPQRLLAGFKPKVTEVSTDGDFSISISLVPEKNIEDLVTTIIKEGIEAFFETDNVNLSMDLDLSSSKFGSIIIWLTQDYAPFKKFELYELTLPELIMEIQTSRSDPTVSEICDDIKLEPAQRERLERARSVAQELVKQIDDVLRRESQ